MGSMLAEKPWVWNSGHQLLECGKQTPTFGIGTNDGLGNLNIG
jgi:hypothetical protein